MSSIQEIVKRKFHHLSNQQLVDRANELPDFQWDDEETELARRIKASDGELEIKMIGSSLQIIRDNTIHVQRRNDQETERSSNQ